MEHADTKNFIVSYPETPEEREGLYSLNRAVHGGAVENMAKKMIERHPDIREEDFLIVKDRETNSVAATLSMIPWRLRYHGIELKALEMGIVATDKNYRMKGLQRLLNSHFERHMASGDYDMSLIQGIPGFYGNFGYHYAIPLENQVIIELHSIAPGEEDSPYAVRKAREEDYEFIAERYAAHVASYDISSVHTAEHYRFIADHTYGTETDSDLFVVSENGTPAGYFRITLHGFTEGLMLSEVSDMNYDHYAAVLRYLRLLAEERGRPFIKCVLPDFHDFTRFAYAMGSHHRWSYQFQVKLTLKRFFTSIKPLLEERVRNSMFRGLSYRLPVSFFRTGIAIEFTDGMITSIEDYRAQQEECCMPLRSFYPLAMGCSSLARLMAEDNEIFMTGKNRLLMDTLFPPANSYLYVHY